MLLKNLIKNIPKDKKNINITGLAIDSNKIKKDYIFFAIKGNKINGENFVKDAIKKESARPFKIPKGIKMLVVNSITGERASYSDESIIIEAFKEKDLVNNKIQYGNVDYISKENIYKFY